MIPSPHVHVRTPRLGVAPERTPQPALRDAAGQHLNNKSPCASGVPLAQGETDTMTLPLPDYRHEVGPNYGLIAGEHTVHGAGLSQCDADD